MDNPSLRRKTESRLPRSCLSSYLLAYVSHAFLTFPLFRFYPAPLRSMQVYSDVSLEFHEMFVSKN